MASNSKYNIDVNKVRKPGNVGTSGIFIGTGSGNRESFYAVRGTGNGNVVIYDKVLYELEMNNITNVSAAGANVALSSYIVKNQRTHGSGTIDSALTFTPTSITIQPNTDTANTKTGEVTVTQFDDALNDYVGASVTISWAQEKDYPVSIALTLNTPSDIPAGGGSVSSVGNSVSCTYRSGNVRQLGANEYSISWGSAVSASSLTNIEKARTKIGNLTATASYTCNGVTVSASTSVPVYQQENKIESTEWGNVTTNISPTTATVSSASTSQLFTGSASQTGTNTYTSTHTAETTNNSFTWEWSSSNNAFTANSTTNTCNVTFGVNQGTTEKSTTITVSATGLSNKNASAFASLTQSAGSTPPGQTPTIVLDGAFYEILPANQTVTLSSAGTRTSPALNIISDTDLTWSFDATTIPGWLYVGRTGGTGPFEVVISGAPNESDFRSTTAKINLRFGNGSVYGVPQESIIVKQDEASPTPPTPTPTTPTFHMSNSSNVYDLYGNFTITTTGTLSGDWPRGTSRDMYLQVPFNITGFSGAVLKGSTSVSWPSKVRFTIGSNYYDMSVSVTPSDEGVVNWTGTIPISQGDNVVISFL